MHDASPPTDRYRWAVLGGVWLMYFSFGICVASTGPLVAVIARDLGTTYTAMGAVLGAWQLVYIAAALPLGAALDRIGVALGLTLSAGIMAASLFLRGAAGDGTELFLAVALFGLGGPLVSIGAPKLIALWFQGPDRGMAMGIYITGVNIGAIVALSATNAVLMPLTGGSWRAVLWIWGGLVLGAGALWWALSRHPEARHRDRAGGMSKGESLGALLGIARLRVVQVVLVMSVGIFFVNHGLGNWLPEILRDKGMTPAAAGLWAAIPTVVGVLGALVIPRLATPERRTAIMGGLILAAIAATLLLQLAPGAGLAAGLILQGVARSSMMTVAILLLMEAPGVPPARAGMAGGMFFTVAEIGGVLGPLSVGALSDVSGDFALPLAAMTGVCLLLLALLGLLRLLDGVARRARSG
jgi:MFS transporter, CP family, cyanate transporter